MLKLLELKDLQEASRQHGELMVIEKINETINEVNRLEQILDFITGVAQQQAHEAKKEDNDVQ